MPLRDHFRPRLSWEPVHGMWPAVIVQRLNRQLPVEYSARPNIHLGSQFEVDVATFDSPTDNVDGHVEDHGAGAIQPSGELAAAPAPAPTLTLETEIADFDEYEVKVYDDIDRLVAAIELVSPANKDRPESRNQFTTKCATLLQKEVTIVLVDVVTHRQVNLYAELLTRIGARDPALDTEPRATYAVTLRWQPRGRTGRLEAWYHELSVGKQLPDLPLWLNDELAVKLELEASYEQTCRDLRMV